MLQMGMTYYEAQRIDEIAVTGGTGRSAYRTRAQRERYEGPRWRNQWLADPGQIDRTVGRIHDPTNHSQRLGQRALAAARELATTGYTDEEWEQWSWDQHRSYRRRGPY
jgi:hypothetical protein